MGCEGVQLGVAFSKQPKDVVLVDIALFMNFWLQSDLWIHLYTNNN